MLYHAMIQASIKRGFSKISTFGESSKDLRPCGECKDPRGNNMAL
jgi:cytidine deaminase